MVSREQVMNQTAANPFATAWMVVLAGILGVTALCTAVLVGWPAIAYLASRFLG
ncbi:MAG: hypothetical protein Tsb0017_10070 [Geothermobacteraceae bacterium]